MAISSNTLFHFTPTAEYLVGILTNEFHPRYCLEKIALVEYEFELAYPMVCFCDIPLSQIKNHVKTYGNYGIGMTKAWAQKKALNPVLYIRDYSDLAQSISQLQKGLSKDELNQNKYLKDIKSAYLQISRFLKPYDGDLQRGNKLLKNVNFYNEREWRYLPKWPSNIPIWLTKVHFKNHVIKAQENEKLKGYKLSFEPNDIAYIIVKEEKEIFPMINALKEIKGKYDHRTIETLISRIITCDQILNDF